MRIHLDVYAKYEDWIGEINPVYVTRGPEQEILDMKKEGWLFIQRIDVEVPDVRQEVTRHQIALVKKKELDKMKGEHYAKETQLEGVIQSLLALENRSNDETANQED